MGRSTRIVKSGWLQEDVRIENFIRKLELKLIILIYQFKSFLNTFNYFYIFWLWICLFICRLLLAVDLLLNWLWSKTSSRRLWTTKPWMMKSPTRKVQRNQRVLRLKLSTRMNKATENLILKSSLKKEWSQQKINTKLKLRKKSIKEIELLDSKRRDWREESNQKKRTTWCNSNY